MGSTEQDSSLRRSFSGIARFLKPRKPYVPSVSEESRMLHIKQEQQEKEIARLKIDLEFARGEARYWKWKFFGMPINDAGSLVDTQPPATMAYQHESTN